MVKYRRNRIQGGTYFFTVTLSDRRSKMLTEHIELLRDAFRTVRRERPFEIVAMVVLPEHLHAVWTLPERNDDYPGRWRAIKGRFTRLVRKDPGFRYAASRLRPDKRGEYGLWQRRYWEHTVRDENDLARHVDYIHYNPVKHGLVQNVADWPYSSFHRYVRMGRLEPGWSGNVCVRENGGNYGE